LGEKGSQIQHHGDHRSSQADRRSYRGGHLDWDPAVHYSYRGGHLDWDQSGDHPRNSRDRALHRCAVGNPTQMSENPFRGFQKTLIHRDDLRYRAPETSLRRDGAAKRTDLGTWAQC
jgi:hypothetical protein